MKSQCPDVESIFTCMESIYIYGQVMRARVCVLMRACVCVCVRVRARACVFGIRIVM